MQIDSAGGRLQQSGFICVALIARYYDISVDVAHLAHLHGQSNEPCSSLDILRALKRLKLKAREIDSDWSNLENISLPAIAEDNNGDYFIVAKVSSDKALIHDVKSQRPLSVSKEDFLEKWSGKLILVTKRSLLPGDAVKFDISWPCK